MPNTRCQSIMWRFASLDLWNRDIRFADRPARDGGKAAGNRPLQAVQMFPAVRIRADGWLSPPLNQGVPVLLHCEGPMAASSVRAERSEDAVAEILSIAGKGSFP